MNQLNLALYEFQGSWASWFQCFSVREASILGMYYGLNGYVAMSLEEIGTHLGLTSERVRQVKTKAIRKLKEMKNSKRLKTYL